MSNSQGSRKVDENGESTELPRFQRKLIYHGAMSLLLGLASGIPYTGVVIRDHSKDWSMGEQHQLASTLKWLASMAMKTPGTERAWKMAHLEGLLNGLLVWIVAAILPALKGLSSLELSSLTNALLVAAYGNSVASIFCAAGSSRGLIPGGTILNTSANYGFTAAVGGIGYGLYLIIKGSKLH